MLFSASIIFAVLFPFSALLAEAVARTTPASYHVVVAAVLGGAYFTIVGILQFSKACWEDLGVYGNRNVRRMREVLEVRGLEWLNLVGMALIGTIAAIFVVAGMLPYPFWFLFGAIGLGCIDMFRGRPFMGLPIDLPPPRKNLEIHTIAEEGKRCEFRWLPWNSHEQRRQAGIGD